MTKDEDVRLDDNEIKRGQCKGLRRYCQRQRKMKKKQTMTRQRRVMPWHEKKKKIFHVIYFKVEEQSISRSCKVPCFVKVTDN